MTMVNAAKTNTINLNLFPFFIAFTSKKKRFEEMLEDNWSHKTNLNHRNGFEKQRIPSLNRVVLRIFIVI